MPETNTHPSVQPHQVIPLVERAHAVIEALCVRAPRPVTTAVLAHDLGVGARTIERGPYRSATALTARDKLLDALLMPR